ncbi:hypothetical protein FLACHUCJ7_02601 [Flavobacterium chungangense]|uniref:Uncharacterized protein n=1 Tax=Flavobacterium chungangense TaxID=554283 RepID=A0A6V6Z2G0_9FLAO|nr:hypothetical protein FLACHUCJ7_02601 [Flavobacterium chungangense]
MFLIFSDIDISINIRSPSDSTLKYLLISFKELLMLFSSFLPFSSQASFNPTVLLNTNFEGVESLSTVK